MKGCEASTHKPLVLALGKLRKNDDIILKKTWVIK